MKICQEHIEAFERHLFQNETAKSTIGVYRTTVADFVKFLDGRDLEKDLVLEYKSVIMDRNMSSTVNSKIGPLNLFLRFLGYPEMCVKRLRIQRQIYYPEEKELLYEEYVRLVRTAEAMGNQRIALALQMLCATGIRVGELAYITVEAAKRGRAIVRNKGKTRIIFIPEALSEKILRYAQRCGILSGPVILTSTGRPLDRTNMWRYMNRLCEAAGIDTEKGHPHALRHLFAATHYKRNRDPIGLADLLGHSCLDTTRIYTATNGKEQIKQLNKLNLVV